jgi:hypothetical protein
MLLRITMEVRHNHRVAPVYIAGWPSPRSSHTDRSIEPARYVEFRLSSLCLCLVLFVPLLRRQGAGVEVANDRAVGRYLGRGHAAPDHYRGETSTVAPVYIAGRPSLRTDLSIHHVC